jgi:hypothetical protein
MNKKKAPFNGSLFFAQKDINSKKNIFFFFSWSKNTHTFYGPWLKKTHTLIARANSFLQQQSIDGAFNKN